LYEIGFITASSETEAEKIAEELVNSHLVACANIFPKIKSIYFWNGKLEKDEESFIIIKTHKNLKDKIIQKIKEIHSYDVPECIFFSISSGLKEYLKWIDNNTKDFEK